MQDRCTGCVPFLIQSLLWKRVSRDPGIGLSDLPTFRPEQHTKRMLFLGCKRLHVSIDNYNQKQGLYQPSALPEIGFSGGFSHDPALRMSAFQHDFSYCLLPEKENRHLPVSVSYTWRAGSRCISPSIAGEAPANTGCDQARCFLSVARTAPGPAISSAKSPFTFSARPASTRLTPKRFGLANMASSLPSALAGMPSFTPARAA